MSTPAPSATRRSVRPPGPLVIEIEGVTKLYRMGAETVHALRGVDVKIHRNEYLAIMGPSGSGKSTLMNMLGCLDTPTAGRYEFNRKNVATMGDDELADIRNREIGFVFQTFNLLARATALHSASFARDHGVIETVVGQAVMALDASVPQGCIFISPKGKNSLVHLLGIEDA